ncbi:hypothetical protein ACFSKW_33565 [Nonomuraea mangrovi]|uniref:Uncharacterized protein n=2 Tax=Streptosporangiaceae TaxID=2004 RepID=A0ABW4T4X9_9ACTN
MSENAPQGIDGTMRDVARMHDDMLGGKQGISSSRLVSIRAAISALRLSGRSSVIVAISLSTS